MAKRGHSNSKDFLGLLQDSARKGTLLSSCEVEVQELMRQLDLHITARCKKWEEEVVGLTEQLQCSRQQVEELQDALLVKTSELDEVKKKARQSELEYQAKMADCEAQLLQLRASLTSISNKYAELRQKKYFRGDRGQPPKRKTKEEREEMKYPASSLHKSSRSNYQKETCRLPGEGEGVTVNSRESLHVNICAPLSKKDTHTASGSGNTCKRSLTGRDKGLPHTVTSRDNRNARTTSHELERSSNGEKDRDRERTSRQEDTGGGVTAKQEEKDRTVPSSSDQVDQLVEEHIKLLNQDLLRILKTTN